MGYATTIARRPMSSYGSTLPMPSFLPATTRGFALSADQPVPRRHRVLGRTWEAARWLAGLPALVDADDLDNWLCATGPGAVVAYHCGPNLAAARRSDPRLDLLARSLLARSTGTVFKISGGWHLRGSYLGSSDVVLACRRLGDEDAAEYLYCARRC